MRVKICGVTSVHDAGIAEDAGADAVGIVVCSDSARNVPLETAEEILRSLKPFTTGVCVTHSRLQDEFMAILDLKPGAVQASYPFQMKPGTGTRLIRVVKPGEVLPTDCDALVIDESRGSGKIYNPAFARDAVRTSKVPVLLAGGLTPVNVEAAIEEVQPYAVDVASGVETSPGIKDPRLVRAFIRAAKGSR